VVTTEAATRLDAIPGPAGHRMLGMAPAFRRDLLECLLDGFRDHGDLVAYRLGPRRGPLGHTAVAAYHPDDVHQVFTNTAHFGRRTIGFGVLTEMIGTGLLTSEGDAWLRQRRTLQPLFTPRRVGRYAELMGAEAAQLLAEPGTGSGEVIDLHQFARRYAVRVLGRSLFGEEVDEVLPDLYRLVPYGADLVRARTFQPIRLPLAWPTPHNRKMTALRAAMYGLVDRILAKRVGRAEVDADDDLVTRLRAARDPETGAALSNQEIRDQLLVFLLAGQETTSGALTFTLQKLGRDQALQDRVAAEAAGDSGADELARASLREGMRLYPPAYVNERVTTTETELAGHRLPPDTMVLVTPWVTHRHPQYWPEPERFDPERFLGTSDRPRYAYFPFGGGSRSCIGEHFAMLEATVLLQAVLARYRITALDEPSVAPFITLRPRGPVRATLTPR
jgi:cytochrome P450